MPNEKLHYFQSQWIRPSSEVLDVDVCIYGATSAGVVAAVKSRQRGRSVALLNPALHIGGMTANGLGLTDWGKRHVIGGMSRQFYRDLGRHYGKDEEWLFEPHAARQVYERMLEEADIQVHHAQFLEAVDMEAGRIRQIRCLGGLTVRARMFIDASYEGDLLAGANVSFTVGRESNDAYGETLNGSQVRDLHQFSHAVDPYRVEGDPSSGLLPHIEAVEQDEAGRGDHRIQAYCFRVCMTDDPALRVDWQKPAGFNPDEYILASRWYNSEKDSYNEILYPDGELRKHDRLSVRHKTDTNNHGPVSSDYIGANHGWPEGSYEQREQIYQAHVTYQQGLYWFLANDPSVPQRYREAFSRFGLARDEFEETGHWPEQLYVREARRMVSDYILTEHDCMHRRQCEDSVGMGSYTLDSHNCRRIARGGRVFNDGDVQVPVAGPYAVSYRSIVPRRGECSNLAVPVCVAASHIAYGSVRMEPVFMVLGESAAIAVDLALDRGGALRDLPYEELKPELEQAGQVLTADAETPPAQPA